jgi:HD-like signal output (HDOD) protein
MIMSNIISLTKLRQILPAERNSDNLSDICDQARNLEELSAKIDGLLADISDAEPIPQAVALAAGRYAAMQLFELHGRAHAMSFFNDCIATAEICQDIMNEMGEEYSSR